MTEQIYKRVKACAVDGRARMFRFKQAEIAKLYNMLTANKEEILEAIHKDSGRPATEVMVEYLVVLRHLKALFDTVDYNQLQKKAKKDSSEGKVSRPSGVALIVSHESAPLDSLISPLSSAIAAGSVAISVLPPNHKALNELLQPLLLALDRAAYAFLPATTSIQELVKLRFNSIIATSLDSHVRSLLLGSAQRVFLFPAETNAQASNAQTAAVFDKTTTVQDINLIARLVVRGKFFGLGKNIGSVGYVFVHEERQAAFVDALVKETKEMYGGEASLSRDYGRLTSEGEVARLQALVRSEVEKGKGSVVLGGSSDATGFYGPTIVDNVDQNSPLIKTPVKGPVLPVVPFSSLEDVLSIYTATCGQQSYIFADKASIKYLAETLPCHTIFANDVPLEALIGAVPSPTSALRFNPALFTDTVSIVQSGTSSLGEIFAPFTTSRLAALQKLLPKMQSLKIIRVSHPPMFRRSFFPQGLFLVAGTILLTIVSGSGYGLFHLISSFRHRIM